MKFSAGCLIPRASVKNLQTTLKKFNFSFDELTICVNHALIIGKFPITLKMQMSHPYIGKTIQQINQISENLVLCPYCQKSLNGLFIAS